MSYRNAEPLQNVRPANARYLHELRRADRAGRQNDLAARPGLEARLRPGEGDADCPFALEQDGFRVRAVDDAQVGPAENRLQETRRGAPAPALPLVDLEVVRTLVVAAVEVADLWDA